MSVSRNLILLILMLSVLISCKHTVTQEELIKYISDPENGLIQERNINGVNVKVTYRPAELLVHQELYGRDSISEKEIREVLEKYGKQHYFVLSLSQDKKEILSSAANLQQYGMLLNQLSFGMGNHVNLTTDEGDTLHLLDYNYPRLFGMATSTDLLLVFEREQKKAKTLTFRVNEFGLNTGDLKFQIYVKDMNRSDKLIIRQIQEK